MDSISKDSLFNKITWQRSGFFFLCLALFLFPFPRSWTLWPVGIFMFFSLIGWINSYPDAESVKALLSRYKFIILPPVLYFLIHLFYFLTGDGTWTNVEERLLFLLVPVVGLPVFVSDFFRKNIKYLLLAFISGLVIISLYLLGKSFIGSLTFADGSLTFNQYIEPGISRFTWQRLSAIEPSTYLAIKILWASTILLFARDILKLTRIQSFSIFVLFIVMLLLLSVRTELFLLVAIMILFIILRFKNKRFRWISLLLIPLLLISLFLVFKYNARIAKQNSDLMSSVLDQKIDWRNKDPRTRAWSSAIDLIKNKPLLGVGLGAQDSLVAEYVKHGYLTEADVRLNAHNQYLETQLAFGIPGTLILLWMFLVPLYSRKKSVLKELIIPFLIILPGSMLTVSVLVRVWGIMFFIIFYCLLTLSQKSHLEAENEN